MYEFDLRSGFNRKFQEALTERGLPERIFIERER